MLIGALIASGNVFAQSETRNDSKPAVEKNMNGKRVKKDKMALGKGEFRKEKKQRKNPFDGIELTADQQQRLQVLRQGLGPVMPQSYDKSKEDKKLTKEQKQAIRKEKAAKKEEAKKNYLKGVKEILTPDQYVVFLENVYLFSAPEGKAVTHKDRKMKNGNKEGKKGKVSGQKKSKENK